MNTSESFDHSMAINKELKDYIKEEVMADYVAKCVGQIIEKEKRQPTTQELVKIYKEAQSYSDEILKSKKSLKLNDFSDQ